MLNPLVHKTETIDSRTVETALQFRDAIDGFLGQDADVDLAETYVVELVESTLSDGSKVTDIRIRIAEPV